MDFTNKQLAFIVHHLIFPPKLPQTEKSEANGNGSGLLTLVVDAVQKYHACSSPPWQAKWSTAVRALQACAKIQDDKRVVKEALTEAIGRMGPGDWLAVHVSAQNAGLIIREDGDSLIFESFEVSPQAAAVMGAKGNLLRCFPGRAVAIPITTAKAPHFGEQLGGALEQLSVEQVSAVMPISRKAGCTTVEERDTPHPKLVTDMLMSLFAAVGTPVEPVTIQKRIRDDVCWSDTKLPWRRSGLWLVLRVALQRALVLETGSNAGRDQYKYFMVFLISKVGELVLAEAPLPSGALFTVNAKLGRRMLKLGQRVEEFVVFDALKVSQRMRQKIESEWRHIRTVDDEGKVVQKIERDKAWADTALSMRNSKSYLMKALHPSDAPTGKHEFSPPGQSRFTFKGNVLPNLDTANLGHSDSYFSLADFETWVEVHLSDWIAKTCAKTWPSADDCTKLASLIEVYSRAAFLIYDENPLQISSALLVILELWQALDELAVRLFPLLGEYSPEIPEDFLHPLLLPKLAMMKRLNRLEDYLKRRYHNAGHLSPSMFANPDRDSFSVRYFDMSDEHKNLCHRIEQDAAQKKQQKIKEWRESTQRYEYLIRQAAKECEDNGINRRGRRYHDRYRCEPCQMRREAENLSITVYEWPLPEIDSQRKAAVFDLKCPPAVKAWRNATYHIINDLGRTSSGSGKYPAHTLNNYEALSIYHDRAASRITLASNYKSFQYKTHYKAKNFPIALDEILFNNGLHYLLYDCEKREWVANQAATPSTCSKCVSPLPAGPYSKLQYAVDSTDHTTNYVLANQSDCPPEISVNEYIAFGSLRAGTRVQWLNIMRELASSDLTFREEAVTTLILQAAWQAGPASGSVLRDAHVHFEDTEFCRRLLGVIERMLRSTEPNWKEDHSMSTLIALTLRILTLAFGSPGIAGRAMELLRQMRGVTLRWARQLVDQLHRTTEDGQIPATQRRLVKIACLCRMTYDVDPEHLDSMLKEDDDLAHFIECAILIQDNYVSGLRYHLLRDKKLAHALEDPLRSFIARRRNGLDQAIRRIWSAYSVGGSWVVLPSPSDQWVTTSTSSDAHRSAQRVHYNLLEGELLIDGRPLGRLPHEYARHSTFRRIFGTRVLNVSQPDMRGMLYMTAKEVAGYQIYFRMREDGELIIKTRKQFEILELIPDNYLQGDLPMAFVDEHVHWLNPGTGVLELRPLTTLWEPSPKNWQIHLSDPSRLSMKLGRKQLIDIRSGTAVAIANALKPLEEIAHLHATLRDDGGVEVELPRYKLHFSVNKAGLLKSGELAAVVDEDQSVGAMYGLQSRLVLRSSKALGAGAPRRSVLIPYGDVSVKRADGHVCVSITAHVNRVIRYFRYEVDSKLGRLKGFSTLRGRLYRAYLHAVTSYMLPDPLTRRTGTEEALDCLRSASSLPLNPLDEETTALLEKIASLTPKRLFYPEHLKCMQKTEWNEQLLPQVQHDEFAVLAEALVTHSNGLSVLYESAEWRDLRSRGSAHLLQRAKLRNSVFRPELLGEGTTDACDDQEYEGRDRGSVSHSGQKVYEIASLIRDWPSKVNTTTDLWGMLRKWNNISGYGEPMDVRLYSDLLSLPLGWSWGSLYDLCRQTASGSDTFRLMFLFGTLAFGESDMVALRTLLATAFHWQFCDLEPDHAGYTLDQGYKPDRGQLTDLAKRCAVSFSNSAESQLPRNHDWESHTDLAQRRRQAFDDVLERQAVRLADHMVGQWPCETPHPPFITDCHINLDDASTQIASKFETWYKNWQFKSHIFEVQKILDSISKAQTLPRDLAFPTGQFTDRVGSRPERTSVTWTYLLQNPPPELPAIRNVFTAECDVVISQQTAEHEELALMIDQLKGSGNKIRERYGFDLARSLDASRTSSEREVPPNLPCSIQQLEQEHSSWKSLTSNIFTKICISLDPRPNVERVAKLAGHWPSITPIVLLGLLSTSWVATLSESWKHALILYAKAIAMYQRSERLLIYAQQNNLVSFYKEAENPGHGVWSPEQYPDWLLMEIDDDLLIRPVQVEVALEMINPSSKSNSVLQLNMGEGKSSVIIPMVAAAVADGMHLARVIVLKSLAKQMAGLLSERLGGLVNRRIYSIPFSRKTTLDATVVSNLQRMYEECKVGRGVLLVQPEHMLSFKLIGIEKLSSGALPLASRLLESQSWLEQNSRDILDESDEILDVRFQLIYTIGASKPIEGHPSRWLTIQKVFDLISEHASVLQREHPSEIEVLQKISGGFPTLCFLGKGAVPQLLLERVVKDIGQGALPEALFEKCPEQVRTAALIFISRLDIDPRDLTIVTDYFPGKGAEMATLLLLRGLLAHNILLFSLQKKRWMVNYGLDPSRKPACLMAVPYRAKGVPSLNAEFGHPDVAICLTCLSYYYDGLTDDQLRQCFSLLDKTDDPTLEYRQWGKASASLPSNLRQLSGVNLEDDQQYEYDLFPHLRYSKPVIDFFMSHVVFPRECKEFKKKLTTSGWDIPSEMKGVSLTTGFSGTNDSQYLLPCSIKQQDLPALQATSARVLSYVLQPENQHYVCARDPKSGDRLGVGALLSLVAAQKPRIRVLLDVGAQILEWNNRELAREWLHLVPDIDAAIYFDQSDELVVIDREGNLDLLCTSPYRNQLGRCLVYLDDVHTRGTDLKLPTTTRAAVTLGPSLTKDRLVQACMRMRKLGHGQSLVFFAPPEVNQSILEVVGEPTNGSVTGTDVVKWALEQTCRSTETNQALWVNQGLSYNRRKEAHRKFSGRVEDLESLGSDPDVTKDLLRVLEEPEARTLHSLYHADTAAQPANMKSEMESPEDSKDSDLQEINRVARLLSHMSLKHSTMEEEQERELAHEMEVERQVQRPAKLQPLTPQVHPDVRRFVEQGVLTPSGAFVEAFSVFHHTSASHLHPATWSTPNLLVTTDFTRTVEIASTSLQDEYLQSVHWVLTSNSNPKDNEIDRNEMRVTVVISAFEANELLPSIRKSEAVRLHVYAPKVGKVMWFFDDLTFYSTSASRLSVSTFTIPTAARRMLNILAGQLYLQSYGDYRDLCQFLDRPISSPGKKMMKKKKKKKKNDTAATTGYKGRETLARAFLSAVLNMRRRGQGFRKTHLGQVVAGKIVDETEF